MVKYLPMKTQPSVEKLHKFFSLEAQRGYDNGAVMGGLARMLENWEAEARADGIPEEIIRAVSSRLRDYERLSPASRAEVLRGLWQRIQRSLALPAEMALPSEGGAGAKAPARSTAAPAAAQAKAKPTSPPSPSQRATPQATATTARTPHAPAASASPPVAPLPLEAFQKPVTVVPDVGPRRAKTLARLGITTLEDLLYHFPRRYDDYSLCKPIRQLRYGEQVTVVGTVEKIVVRQLHGGKRQMVEAFVGDGSATLRVTWFNQTWIADRLRKGMAVALAGKVDQYLGRLVLNNPEWEPLDEEQLSTKRIVPVYPLTAKITQRWMRRLMHQVVSQWAPRMPDPLPPAIRTAAGLPDLPTALQQIHFPTSWDDLHAAQRRLAFDEVFLLQLGVLRQREAWRQRTARTFTVDDAWLEAQMSRLPFTLTRAQRRALEDIRQDLASGHPMNRLLQGDVGSGKTVVAALAMGMVVKAGSQAALMAPTAILAEQHYRTLRRLLAEESGLLGEGQIRLLVGNTPAAERREILAGLAAGEVKVLVGTHALLEEPVQFADLQLAVIDEQHRFGVRQRARLRAKGEHTHILVMTATPIPRSLALTIYGDLDLTVMDEMPPGRQPVGTYLLMPRERERAYRLIRREIEAGHQAFIIYPLIEPSEALENTPAAVPAYQRLQEEVFPDLQIGLLHGKMKPDEKDAIMARFRDGAFQILVSTPVVEVGVDVPNATVMLIEGANRFGLAQLHQFRGRVGRGGHQAYCILIPETENAAEENERLRALVETNDGFVLAEKDLQQRGPGEFFGTRQSGFGFTRLRMANLLDVHLIEQARNLSQQVIAQDATLEHPEHRLLAQRLEAFWAEGQGEMS